MFLPRLALRAEHDDSSMGRDVASDGRLDRFAVGRLCAGRATTARTLWSLGDGSYRLGVRARVRGPLVSRQRYYNRRLERYGGIPTPGWPCDIGEDRGPRIVADRVNGFVRSTIVRKTCTPRTADDRGDLVGLERWENEVMAHPTSSRRRCDRQSRPERWQERPACAASVSAGRPWVWSARDASELRRST